MLYTISVYYFVQRYLFNTFTDMIRMSMQSRKFDLEKSYKTAEKEANSLKQKLSNIEQYMGKDISIEKSTSREEDLIQ